MEYSIDFLTDKKIVRVKMKGRLNFQTANQYSTEAIKLARDNDCNNFLIDHSETTLRNGVKKLYASEDEFQQFGFKNTDRIAILIADTGDDSNLPNTETQNIRQCKVNYFYPADIAAAFEWLLES